MKDWLKKKLRDPFAQLEQSARRRLELAGLYSPEELRDVVEHIPHSRRILVEELGVSRVGDVEFLDQRRPG